MTIQVGPASRGMYVSTNVLGGVQPGHAHPPPTLSVCTLVSFFTPSSNVTIILSRRCVVWRLRVIPS